MKCTASYCVFIQQSEQMFLRRFVNINFNEMQIGTFLICFPMDYIDFLVKSKVIISLFQTVRLSLSIFTVCKFVLSLIKY